HVDRAGGERPDHGPLERPGGQRGVARDDDVLALAQGRGVRAGQADAELGRDLDVDQPADAARAEQVALAARLPDDAGVDDGPGLYGLERVDLDPARHVRLGLDDALVADDRVLLYAGAAHDVGGLADHAAAQVGAGAQVDVVVHDRAVQEGALAHHRVVAEHRVLAQLGAGLDLGV